MVTEENVKNIFIEYSKNKMTFLAKRLKELRTLYINEKFETYANYLKKYYLDDDNKKNKKIKKNTFLYRKKILKIGIASNNILQPSLSCNNLLSDNISNLNSQGLETIYHSHRKEKAVFMHNLNIDNNDKIKIKNNNKDLKAKININKVNSKNINSFLIDNYQNNKNCKINLDSDNDKNKEEKKVFKTKTHTLPKTSSQKLIKFKDFNKLIINQKKTKNNRKFNSTQNSFFKNYLKRIKKLGLDKVKKPEITPFSDLLFSLADKKKKNIFKSKSSSYFNYEARAKYPNFNKEDKKYNYNQIECLVLDKLIDKEGYSKYNENEQDKYNQNIKLKIKDLKKKIKEINKKKKFPQHLIRRFEANRKINFFPEKYLIFVK